MEDSRESLFLIAQSLAAVAKWINAAGCRLALEGVRGFESPLPMITSFLLQKSGMVGVFGLTVSFCFSSWQ